MKKLVFSVFAVFIVLLCFISVVEYNLFDYYSVGYSDRGPSPLRVSIVVAPADSVEFDMAQRIAAHLNTPAQTTIQAPAQTPSQTSSQAALVCINKFYDAPRLIRQFILFSHQVFNHFFAPDFILFLEQYEYPLPKATPSYLFLYNKLLPLPKHCDYEGFFISAPNPQRVIKILNGLPAQANKLPPEYRVRSAYFSHAPVAYSKKLEDAKPLFKMLFHCTSENVLNLIYMGLWERLAQDGKTYFYGDKSLYSCNITKSSAYRGTINYEECGVGLCLHNLEQLDKSVPSVNFFDLVSHGLIVICDKNAFIIENFGDNVLYIDHTQSMDEMYRQISDHLEWIAHNPQEAQAKATEAQRIFTERFSLNHTIAEILALHNQSIN